MFIQVIQGKVSDADAVRVRFTDWVRNLGPTAEGWLGSTEGVTENGDFVAVVRFRDEDSARRNSARPEQGEWWAETESLFDGEVQFHDYPHTTLWMGGGSDDAGFVQVIQGTQTGDASPGDMDMDEERMSELRPDVIGGTIGWDDDGHFTQTVYFTSEEAAREGERALASDPGISAQMNEWVAQVEGLRYLDLSEPRMASA
jgi:hypothetical protein